MYQSLLKWCKDSEVILASRIQVLLGIVITALSALLPLLNETNLSYFLGSPKAVSVTLIASGVIMELLRTYRATDLRRD